MPEVRPRHLVEDPRFLQPVAAGLERRKRLAVEVERAREVARRGSQLRESAERQPSTLRVTQPLLDRERVGVAGARRVGVAREAVQDPVEGQSERLRPGEADGAAAFNALRRPAEPRLDVAPEQREGATERADAELAIGAEFRRDAVRLDPLLVRSLELAEDPRGEARRDQRTRPPERRRRATVGLDERCRVLARGQVLAADVPVEEEVAAQLQTRLAR